MPATEVQGLAGSGFIPGQYADYEEEAYPNPSFTWLPGKPLQIKKRYYLYAVDKLNLFLNALTGWPFMVGGVLYRNLPEQINLDQFDAITDPSNLSPGKKPKYYCTEILSVTPEIPNRQGPTGDPDDPDSHGEFDTSDGKWMRFVIEARFEQPLYTVDFKSNITSETDRNTYIRERSIDKSLNVTGTNQTVYWNNDATIDPTKRASGQISSTVELPLGYELVIMDWLEVPLGAFNNDRIKSFYGTVNDAMWPFSDWYEAGTLMLKSFNKTQRRQQIGDITYDLQFVFLYVENRMGSSTKGHNALLNKSLLPQKIQLGKTGSDPVFKTNDFDQIFLP